MVRTSQVAMEIVMTYGLALLAVLVVLAALSHFGVLNTDRYLPEKCDLATVDLKCANFASNSTHLTLNIENNMDKNVYDFTLSARFIKDGLGKSKSMYDLNYSYYTIVKSGHIPYTGAGKVLVDQDSGLITGNVISNGIIQMICIPQKTNVTIKSRRQFLCGAIPTDFCRPNPCQNNGTCTDEDTNYQCICANNFTGTNCEINETIIDPEEEPVCTNNSSNSSICVPPIETNLCDQNPCIHGMCAENSSSTLGYTCSCQSGYIGNNCESVINNCTNSPCVHGTCTDTMSGYACFCQSGYVGANCETNINDCIPNSCVHGTCIDGINQYTCDCDESHDGKNCDHEIYIWGGFEGDLLKTVNAGRTIPVKFGIRGITNTNIFEDDYPRSGNIDCSLTGTITDNKETDAAGNSFHDGTRYHYNWKTKKSWAGSCRQFIIKLNDGTTHYAYYRFV